MEKKDLKGYMELTATILNHHLDCELSNLLKAADDSAIHTFGWPIGVVLHVDGKKPTPYERGIKATIDTDHHFDYWSLDRNGDYYILSGLFEDSRRQNEIFIDTRTVRTTEAFWRTARLYRELGVPDDKEVVIKLEYGGLKNRKLTAANSMRAFTMYDRSCSVDIVSRIFQKPLRDFFDNAIMKENVFEMIKAITENCDFFVPSKEAVTDPIVEAYLNGKIL